MPLSLHKIMLSEKHDYNGVIKINHWYINMVTRNCIIPPKNFKFS